MKGTAYTKEEQDALDHLAHMARFGWRALTGRSITARTMRKLAARGLVKDAGATVVVDGDGFTKMPERYRTGWELTDPGAAEVERLKGAPQALNGYLVSGSGDDRCMARHDVRI